MNMTSTSWILEWESYVCSPTAFEFTPTLLVNKFSWSYHKVALDLWGSRIWLNVSIFYQFHKAKSRYLSSEPGHWFKKQLSKFSWNQSKDLTFAQIFAFCDLNVIFDNSNWIECVYILKFQIGVNSKAVQNTWIYCSTWDSIAALGLRPRCCNTAPRAAINQHILNAWDSNYKYIYSTIMVLLV